MEKGALLSQCRKYRYDLWRTWASGDSYAMFVGLNPSTADEDLDDPTIRRCVAFAKAWGYEGLCMTNLFAYRATAPADMMRALDPVGPLNDEVLHDRAAGAGVIVAAWGVHGKFDERERVVRTALPKLHYLRLTKNGYPGHPLYLPKTLEPMEWF